MRRRIALVPVLAIAIAGLSGCVPADGPIAVRPATGANEDALLQGILRIEEDCVWVQAGDEVYVPVFEIGGARIEGGDTLVYGNRYVDGDDIELPGGEAQKPGADWYLPARCPDVRLWAAGPPLRPS
ncbi:dihydrolipoamide dehydrogenase [Microbacterium sp. NPDC019599]|uniref:dihydrolipoamide dehydrogenase n=1 Tax=Microbacterium sp. NPDC019599 TaxID=3154690 RepID=UPI00340AC44F